MSTGQIIRGIRERLDMSQIEFSKSIGCSQSALSKYELGQDMPSIKVAKSLVKFVKSKRIKIKLEDVFPDGD